MEMDCHKPQTGDLGSWDNQALTINNNRQIGDNLTFLNEEKKQRSNYTVQGKAVNRCSWRAAARGSNFTERVLGGLNQSTR